MYRWMFYLTIVTAITLPLRAQEPLPLQSQAVPTKLFAQDNLIAWCIVPFDSKKRGPQERAEMLHRLGFQHFAYDYRAEHIPTFDAEIAALNKYNVELTAWWFPQTLNAEAKQILEVLKRHGIKTQLWISGSGAPTKSP